jgi:hypothetical protein
MVLDKPPYNNKEMPLYFLRKLCTYLILGKDVNYFDIEDIHSVTDINFQK